MGSISATTSSQSNFKESELELPACLNMSNAHVAATFLGALCASISAGDLE